MIVWLLPRLGSNYEQWIHVSSDLKLGSTFPAGDQVDIFPSLGPKFLFGDALDVSFETRIEISLRRWNAHLF